MKGKINLLILSLSIIILAYFLLVSPFQEMYLQGLGVTMTILTAMWIFTLIIKDSSIIDIYWGFGYVILVWFYLWWLGEDYWTSRNFFFSGLVSIWGLRLTIYLAWRNIGKGEDPRYVEWRKEAGRHWWWISYWRVFVLQGVLLWVISSLFGPALKGGDEGLVSTDYIGVGLWVMGLYFEGMGDWQLAKFKANPANKGKVMNKGLWKYTRHPNYFGDAVVWWSFFCFALAYHNGLLWFMSPFLMTFLLVRISGAAMLESNLKKTKPKYAEYIRQTSVFFPMLPKK